MPIDASAFGRDMQGIIDDAPVSCAYGTATFNATVGESRRTNDVAGEGVLQEADLEIMALVSDFGTQADVPDVQETLTVAGTKYHITERIIDPAGAWVHFVLRRI